MLYEAFNHIKNFIPVVLLLNAAVQDFKRKELGASAWLPIITLGVFSLCVELTASPNRVETITRLVATLTTFSTLYFLNLYEAGDAVIVIGLSLTHISTKKPLVRGCFIQTLFPDFGFTILWNTELMMLILVSLKTVSKKASEALRTCIVKNMLLHIKIAHLMFSNKTNGEDCDKPSVLKQKIPLVSLLLPGYVITILFGSIAPLPFQTSSFSAFN